MQVGPTAASALLSVSLALSLPAQDTATTAAVAPAAAHLTIEAVGPAGWHAQFGPTNVGGLLASQEGRPYWEPQIAPMFAMWHQLLGSDADYEAMRARVLGYSGAMRFAVRFGNGPGSDDMSEMVVAFEPDGRTDLKALAADFRTLIERSSPGEWNGEYTALGATAQLRRLGDTAMTAPFVAGERMVILVASNGDLTDARTMLESLTAAPVAVGQKRPGSPALRLRLELARLLEDNGTFSGSDGELMKALGFDSLGAMTMEVASAGPHVTVDVGVEFVRDERGILAALMPDAPSVPALGHLLTDKTAAWRIGRFDLGALFSSAVSAIEAMRFNDGDVRESMKKELGLDVEQDLLAHMGDEVLVIGSPLTNYDRLRESTWAIAWQLKDDVKFAKSFDQLMPQAKPFFSPSETVDVDGVALRRYGNMINYPVWIAVGRGLLVITCGRDAEEEATRILTAAAEGAAAPKPAPDFADLKRHLPAGLNGVATIDLADFGGVPAELWLEVLDEVLPFVGGGPSIDPEEAEEEKEKLFALLKANNLTTVRTANGFAARNWHWRLFW
ncbi:MAG: hypothetical protein R3F29_03295 [Planctomycetota bacterium]